jgi:hypothetical protein
MEMRKAFDIIEILKEMIKNCLTLRSVLEKKL